METAIRLLNEMVNERLVESYAIGGAMAALFYAEPIVTFDLDVFVLLPEAQATRPIVTLEPQFDFLRQRGAVQRGEHLVIGGVPVQLLPAWNALIIEATRQAVARSVGGETTRVCRREHLLAILVQTGRDKDRARLPLLLEGTKPDERLLGEILDRHDLRGRWNEWATGRHAG